MNNYEVTKCPRCSEVIVTSELGTIRVAGWKNLEDVTNRLEHGEALEDVGKDYCSYCLHPIATHSSREEHEKHPEWLPYHEPEPQSGLNRYV